MSNEFVMVPREWVENAVNAGAGEVMVLSDIATLTECLSQLHQGEPVALQCWSCRAAFTLKDRSDCDGCCWKCGVEIDLEDYAEKFDGEVERLRAENEAFDAGMRNLACQLSAGGYNSESLTADQLLEKVQWGLTNLTEAQARLVDGLRAQLAERDERIELHVKRRMELAEQITEMHRQIKQLRATLQTIVDGGQWGAEGRSHEEALKACAGALADGEKPNAKPGVLEIEDCTFDNRPIPSGYTLGSGAELGAQGVEDVVLLGHFHPGDGHGAVLKWDPIDHEQKEVALSWRDALQQCAELLGMQCGDDLAGVPERLKSALSAVPRDEWMEFEKRFGPGTWGHVDYANEQIAWKCRAALEKKDPAKTLLNDARLVMVATYSLLINGSLTPLHAQSYSDMESLKDRIKKALNNVKAPDGKPYLPKHWLGNAP